MKPLSFLKFEYYLDNKMANPWEKYCAYIKNVETVLLNNIKDVSLHWSLYKTPEEIGRRNIFFESLFNKNNLDIKSLDLDIRCPISGIYSNALINNIITYNSNILDLNTLEKIIKFRCFAATSLSLNDLNEELKKFGDKYIISYDLIRDRFIFPDFVSDTLNYLRIEQCIIINKPNLINIIRSYQDNKVEKNNNSDTIDVNDFTKEVRSKKIVYEYTSEFIYDYEHIKESKKELHNEFYIGYKYFKKSIDKHYIPQAVLIKNLK